MSFLFNFPFPVSTNNALAHGYFGGSIRTYPTKEYKEFQLNVNRWAEKNIKFVVQIRNECQKWLDDGGFISVTLLIELPPEDYYTKTKGAKHRVKCFDVTNRIKQCHDSLSKLIGIDDRYFRPTKEDIILCEGMARGAILILSKSDAPLRLNQKNRQRALESFVLPASLGKEFRSVLTEFNSKEPET